MVQGKTIISGVSRGPQTLHSSLNRSTGGPKQFRSTLEFAPHAAWLLSPNRESILCQCPRCPAGRERRRSMKLESKKRSSPINTPIVLLRGDQQAEPSSLANLSIAVTPREGTAQAHLLTSHVVRQSRLFRKGELVWLALSTPLVNEAAPDPTIRAQSSIRYWPAIVEDYRLQSIVSAVSLDDPPDYIVEQVLTYQVRFICLAYSKVVQENELLAYKLHNPLQETVEYIQTLPAPSIPLSRHPYWFRLYKEASLPGVEIEEEASVSDNPYMEAILQYAVALQVAAHIAMMWTPCETWPSHNHLDEDHSFVAHEDREFLGLWWGSELLVVGELVLLSCSLAHLVPHPSISPHLSLAMYNISPKLALRTALVLDLRRIYTADAEERERRSVRPPRRCIVSGRILACLPHDLPSVPNAHGSNPLPRQPPPGSQYRWESVLLPELEAHIEVSLVAGRYYPALPPYVTDVVEELTGEVVQARRPGMYDTSQPIEWMATRTEIIKECMRRARQELDTFWKEGTAQE